ncbi:MAG TPA: SMI1/KNR4 family protein [Polyangia bacterium]
MPSRRKPSDNLFFDGLRTAAGNLPAGLLRLGPPADPAAIAAAESALGQPLPHSYVEFLRSFNGADLFHESLMVCGVGAGAALDLVTANEIPHETDGHKEELVVAESATGDLFTIELEAPETHDEPRVFRVRPDADERWLAGSSFPRWLEATIAHHALIYDADGEFLSEAFEPEGEELVPTFALRQAERALRKDPGSALYQHERGLALRRLGRLPNAREAFGQAAAADPTNPWPWFDLGRCDQELGRHAEAAAAFECAAEAASGPEGARFSAWAARSFHLAGERQTAERLRLAALERAPGLVEQLKAAALAAREEGDDEAADEADALVDLLGQGIPLSRKLPVLARASAPPPPATARPQLGSKPAKSPPPRTNGLTRGKPNLGKPGLAKGSSKSSAPVAPQKINKLAKASKTKGAGRAPRR